MGLKAVTSRCVVLILHGIGDFAIDAQTKVDPYFDRDLREGVFERLTSDERQRVDWLPVVWSAPVLEAAQTDLLTSRKPPWPWRRLFQFVTSSLADASAHQFFGMETVNARRRHWSSAYWVQHRAIRSALAGVERRLETVSGAAAETPVIAAPRSMGCHVLSTYLWDAQQHPERLLSEAEWDARQAGEADPLTPFVRLETLRAALFVGCNIPILNVGTPDTAKTPMRVARQGVAGDGVWENWYDPDDALGYPIENAYRAYFDGSHDHFVNGRPTQPERDPNAETAPTDRIVEIGGPFGLTPLAHTRYWRNGRFRSRLIEEIRYRLSA